MSTKSPINCSNTEELSWELKNHLDKVYQTRKLPNSWKEGQTKGKNDTQEPQTTLLYSIAKIFTKVTLKLLNETVIIRTKQRGFRKNRSTVDAIKWQISERTLEYNSPAYICFINLTRALIECSWEMLYQYYKKKKLTAICNI